MTVIFFILLAFFLFVLVSGVYVFVVGCVRTKEYSWLDSAAMKGTPYEKYDKLIHDSYDWLAAHNAQDLHITSIDGLRLHGLWIPAINPKGTILLAHGYKSTMLVDFGMVLELYHQMGLNLLIPVQRAHGKSQGKIITFGVKESRDMLLWLEYHNKELGDWQIVLSGLSMGASTMMYLADCQLPDNVRGMIVDCGFTSPAAILSAVFKKVTHLPAIPAIWITDLCARIFGGFSIYERDSRRTLAANRLPIIMVHGKDDHFVPCRMTQQGYEACTGEKQVLLVDGAGHGVSYLYAMDQYGAMVKDFLKKHITGF